MNITKIALYELKIPLRFQFTQSNNSGSSTSHSLILQLEDESGIKAYGEACPRSYVTGESIESVQEDIQAIANELYQASIQSVRDISRLMRSFEKKGLGQSSICLIELAMLDWLAQSTDKNIPDLFDLQVDKKLQYSLILPLTKSAQLEQLLDAIPPFDPIAIKIKVDNRHQNNLDCIRLLQSRFNAPIRVDVNGGWTQEEALEFMPDLIDLGVVSFEECLSVGDIGGMQTLMHHFGKEIDLMADESLCSLADAQKLIEAKAVSAFNIKISKVGGLGNALAIQQLAQSRGIICQLGAHYGESSILSRAGITFASTPGVDLVYMEGSFGKWLLKEGIIPRPITHTLKGDLDILSNFPEKGLSSDLIFNQLDQHSRLLIRSKNKKMFVC